MSPSWSRPCTGGDHPHRDGAVVKIAIVLFNLGGPDSLEAVQPFLRNLFSDPAIIALPSWLR
ncbi:MAG TPA: ferrochelatase, partial [Reyranella sp.]|nr:ferrochelatase [Reyranella sp.]